MPAPFVGNPRRQCDGKIPYRDKADAKRARSRAETHGILRRGRMVIYRCPWCSNWHLGHPVRVDG